MARVKTQVVSVVVDRASLDEPVTPAAAQPDAATTLLSVWDDAQVAQLLEERLSLISAARAVAPRSFIVAAVFPNGDTVLDGSLDDLIEHSSDLELAPVRVSSLSAGAARALLASLRESGGAAAHERLLGAQVVDLVSDALRGKTTTHWVPLARVPGCGPEYALSDVEFSINLKRFPDIYRLFLCGMHVLQGRGMTYYTSVQRVVLQRAPETPVSRTLFERALDWYSGPERFDCELYTLTVDFGLSALHQSKRALDGSMGALPALKPPLMTSVQRVEYEYARQRRIESARRKLSPIPSESDDDDDDSSTDEDERKRRRRHHRRQSSSSSSSFSSSTASPTESSSSSSSSTIIVVSSSSGEETDGDDDSPPAIVAPADGEERHDAGTPFDAPAPAEGLVLVPVAKILMSRAALRRSASVPIPGTKRREPGYVRILRGAKNAVNRDERRGTARGKRAAAARRPESMHQPAHAKAPPPKQLAAPARTDTEVDSGEHGSQ